MAFCDFVVKYNPDIDKPEDITKKILYSIWVKRIKHNKPVNAFIGGDSGEGKSFAVLRLQEILGEIQAFQASAYVQQMNVFTPLEYPQKLDGLLYDKTLKKINIIAIHEARDVVRAKQWMSFMVQAIADVNQQARQVKRLITLIVSQFIRDIAVDMRYTLQYYCIARRPKGKPTRLYINVLWKDDRDLERPRLRKRKLSGYLRFPDGRLKRFVPQYLEMSKPKKETIALFEAFDREAKSQIIRRKLDRLIDEMKAEVGSQSDKVESMLKYYKQHPEHLDTLGKRFRGSWRLRPEVKTMHGLDRFQAEQFEKAMAEHLKNTGVFDNEASQIQKD